MLEKASEYLGTEHSYRKTVEDKGMPIMYDDRKPSKERLPEGLAPSTVWRWLSWLGGMPGTLRAAWELIRQKEPNATLHRQPWAVSPAKYRSEQRRETLVTGHAGAGGGPCLRADFRPGNLPPLRNRPGLFVR